jgi:hypothetical protein
LDDFNDEEALAWLGPGHLLLAFNSHPLIYRGGASSTSAPRRVIRAVLLDTARRTVERAVDWQINDSHRYLWPLNANHILVHAGNELRIYDANLAVERRFALAGPLDFVRITPNGHIFAVATLQERHSPELHARLHDSLGAEPEEDVNVTILDQAFNTIAHASSVSGLMPPTLLDEGQVNLLAQPNSRYRLVLNKWNSDPLTLARFTSSCAPDISSVAPDLLFLLTCDTATGTTEYRVLGADGKLLLRRQAASREIGQEAVGSQGTGRFAIKVVNASDALSTGMQFKAADLQAEEVRVYRVSDRKRLLSVSVEEPVASLGAYALSPDGASLAVLSQSKILIFPMPID